MTKESLDRLLSTMGAYASIVTLAVLEDYEDGKISQEDGDIRIAKDIGDYVDILIDSCKGELE